MLDERPWLAKEVAILTLLPDVVPPEIGVSFVIANAVADNESNVDKYNARFIQLQKTHTYLNVNK